MPKYNKVRRIYYNVTEQTWDHVNFDKEDCDEHNTNNDAIKQAVTLIRAGRPFVFVPYNPQDLAGMPHICEKHEKKRKRRYHQPEWRSMEEKDEHEGVGS